MVPAGGGTPRALAATPDAQPVILGWSSDGRQLLVNEIDRPRRPDHRDPRGWHAAVALATEGSVTAAALNRTGTALGFALQDVDRAPEPHTARLGATLAPKRVATVQPTFTAPLGRTEPLAWKSPDGQAIEGLLTYPVDYRPGTKVPLLLVIHGGPTGVFVRSFTGTAGTYPIAAFAARGYAVLRANPRGSSGYGKAFRYANHADWGGGDYRDLMTGVDHVIAMGVADPDRLGVMGWSYGGFMTSWVITQTKRFKAASAGAAVTNLMSFTGATDIPGFVPDYFGGEYWDHLRRVAHALGDVPRQGRDHADADPARRERRPRADLAGLRVLQRAQAAGRHDEDDGVSAPAARLHRAEDDARRGAAPTSSGSIAS